MRCSCNLFFVTYGREGGYRKAGDAEASGKEAGDEAREEERAKIYNVWWNVLAI